MTTLFFRILALSLAMMPIILVLWLLGHGFGKRFSASCRYRVWGVVILALCICTCLVSVPTLFTFYLPHGEEIVDTETQEIQASQETSGDAAHTYDTQAQYGTPAVGVGTATPPTSGAIVEPPIGNMENVPPVGNVGGVPPSIGAQELQKPLESVKPTPITTAAFQDDAPAFSILRTETVLFILSHIWLCGAVVYFGIHLIGHLSQTAAYERQKKLCDKQTASIYGALCEKKAIKNAPKLYRSKQAESPMLYGFFRPTVLLPDIELTPNATVGVLAHELTHHKRGDLWQKLFCLIAVSLYWFHPLVHLASKRFHAEMELSCDERVLKGLGEAARRSYGNVMLDIVKRCKHNAHSLTTRFDPHTSVVKERFMNILDMTKKKRGLPVICCTVILCLLAGLIIGCKWEKENKENETDIDGTTTDIVETLTTDTEELDTWVPLLPGDVYSANYGLISKDDYIHYGIPDIAFTSIRDAFTEDGLLSRYGEGNYLFVDVDDDGEEEAVVRTEEIRWPYAGLWEDTEVFDLRDGKLYTAGVPSVKGSVGFEYLQDTKSFLVHCYELGGVQVTYEAFLRGDEFYVNVAENAQLAKEVTYENHNVNLTRYKVNPPKDIAEGEVYTGYRVEYNFICPMYDDGTKYRFYMEIPQIYSEREGAARLNAALVNACLISNGERIRDFEKTPNEGHYRLDSTYESGIYNGVLWISLCENGNLLGTGGAFDMYRTVYYDMEADEALSLSAALARFTEKSGEIYTLPTLLAKLNDALYANTFHFATTTVYQLLPYSINAILPVSDDSFYVIYEREPVEGIFTSAALVTKDGVQAFDGSPGDVAYRDRRVRKLNEQYAGYSEGKYDIETLLQNQTVCYDIAQKINEILAAYRAKKDVSYLLPNPDPDGDYIFRESGKICDDVYLWGLNHLYFAGDYGYKFTIYLVPQHEIKLDLYFDIGIFGDSYQLFFKKCKIYQPIDRFLDAVPTVTKDDIKSYHYSKSDPAVLQELYMYATQDGEKITVYCTYDNESFLPVNLTVPNEWKNGKNEFWAFGHQSSVYVAHTDENGVTYLAFDRTDDTPYSADALRHTQFTFTGAVRASELLTYASNGGTLMFPSVNVPKSADSVDELHLLGLAEDDERDDFIRAFVTGDAKTLEALSAPVVEEGTYAEALKGLEIKRWYAYTETEGNTVRVSFHYATSAEGSATDWKRLYVEEGFDRVYFTDKYNRQGGTYAGTAVYDLLVNSGLQAIPTSDEMSERDRWFLTCYICGRITTKDNYATLEEMKEFAESYLGIKDFTPSDTHMHGELYGEVGHGGTTQVLEIVSAEEGKDGVWCVTVQFYADPSKIVKSHLYRYYVKEHLVRYSTSNRTEWEFVDFEKVTYGKLDPYVRSM